MECVYTFSLPKITANTNATHFLFWSFTTFRLCIPCWGVLSSTVWALGGGTGWNGERRA